MADRIQNLVRWLERSSSMAQFSAGDDEPEIPISARIVHKRPRYSESTSQSQPQRPVHRSSPVQRSRGRTSCMVEEEEDLIPVQEADSDSGSGSEHVGSDDDGEGANSGGGLRLAANNSGGSIPVVLTDPDVLDCPICLDPLSTPIYQCENGHITCSTCCTKSSKKCPSCSLPIGSNRCRAMEKLLESLQIDCKNATFGCKETLIYNKKNKHEKTCPHTACFCPLTFCTFASSAHNLYQHFRTHHAPGATPFCYNTDFDITTQRTQKHVFLQERHEGVLFVLNRDVQGDNRVFNIDCIGSSAFKSGFLYKIRVRMEETCLSVKSEAEVYAKLRQHITMKNCLTVPSYFLGRNGRILVQVCIRKAR